MYMYTSFYKRYIIFKSWNFLIQLVSVFKKIIITKKKKLQKVKSKINRRNAVVVKMLLSILYFFI